VHDLSLYLLELLENSIRAEARHVAMAFTVDRASDRIHLTVDDDGTGLNIHPDAVLDPFYTTKTGKRTGLGLSLLKADAEAAGGYLTLGASPILRGVRVEVAMSLAHIDRPPIGDLVETIMVMEVTNPDVTFTISLYGDQFDPPIIDGSLSSVRDRMARVVAALDHNDAGTPARAPDQEYTTVQSAPRAAPSKGRG